MFLVKAFSVTCCPLVELHCSTKRMVKLTYCLSLLAFGAKPSDLIPELESSANRVELQARPQRLSVLTSRMHSITVQYKALIAAEKRNIVYRLGIKRIAEAA